ncbi:hypothetical protein AX16_005390 [Volvariella volvacea WC 439]|nr:hypothetical protein AX16_005390 [Volvariella volvacea WC 439]
MTDTNQTAKDCFPSQTPEYILSFLFSSWYPRFSGHTIKSTVIRPLSQEFKDYLNADGVFLPEGSEDVPAESTLSDHEDEPEDNEDEPDRKYSFPELDAQIRACIKEYSAVFPKLNFTSPKDASWILPPSSPLKCTSPSDVYMLLKSSDFVMHDLDTTDVFAGCNLDPTGTTTNDASPAYSLELVLRKWYPIDKSRELRCFVRHNRLIGICQRDTNYYDFLNEPAMQEKVTTAIRNFWEEHIKSKFASEDYIFDFLLTRDLTKGHIIDFNPYAQRTDSLLFTFDELQDISSEAKADPVLRVIDSRAHLAAISNAPANQHNMVPFEALSMSSGRDIEEFALLWNDSIRQSATDGDSGEDN